MLSGRQDKRARAETFNGQQVQGDNLLPPGHSTSTRSYLGVEIHQGGLYEPSIFPTETWLEIACIHDDLQVQYSITEHGSSLFKIHALVYDADIEKIHDTTDSPQIPTKRFAASHPRSTPASSSCPVRLGSGRRQ